MTEFLQGLRSNHYYPLHEASLIRCSGRDAERYLHARLTQNIKIIPQGGYVQAAALNAQGKVESLLHVARLGPEEFLLVLESGDRAQQSEALLRFKVADRLTFESVDDHVVVHVTGLVDESYLSKSLGSVNRVGVMGTDILVPRSQAAAIFDGDALGLKLLSFQEFHFLRCAAGNLSFVHELAKGVLLSERLPSSAVSFQKGCYVGQEVIEKIDAFGSAPRMLIPFCVHSFSALVTGAAVTDEQGSSVGEVFSTFSSHGMTSGFLRIKKSFGQQPLYLAGNIMTEAAY